jgi:hypothetical protein
MRATAIASEKKNLCCTPRDYYACDAGCLDPPVQLGPTPVQFPVKLTEPLTAILYITGLSPSSVGSGILKKVPTYSSVEKSTSFMQCCGSGIR